MPHGDERIVVGFRDHFESSARKPHLPCRAVIVAGLRVCSAKELQRHGRIVSTLISASASSSKAVERMTSRATLADIEWVVVHVREKQRTHGFEPYSP